MSVQADIDRCKQRLIRKAQKQGISENFGQREVRELNDKHHYFTLLWGGDTEELVDVERLDNFADWCENYIGETAK